MRQSEHNAATFWLTWWPWLATRTQPEIELISFMLKYEIQPNDMTTLLEILENPR